MIQKFDPVSVAELYDDIADVYSSYYADYAGAVQKQGKDLSNIIRGHIDTKMPRVLDCSCGIGTQAIGMRLNGCVVSGCDISPKSIDQARQNAGKFGVEDIDFQVADMRHIIDLYPARSFDAVVSCGNSLAHLLEDSDMDSMLAGARKLLRTGGVFLSALTDHEDKEPRQENQFYDAHIKRTDDGQKTVNFQVWTWVKYPEIYICDDYTINDATGQPNAVLKKVSAPFRIWRREKLFALAEKHGFAGAAWLKPEDTGHHNPILCLKA